MPDSSTANHGAKLTRWHDAVERLNVDTTISAQAAFERGESFGAREFLWEPLAEFFRRWYAEAAPRRFSRAVLAGYQKLAHAAKLWEADRRWSDRAVVSLRRNRRRWVVRTEWREALSPILDGRVEGERLEGGRGGTTRVATSRGPAVVRRFRRGGAMRWAGELYLGLWPRPFAEFWLLLRARRRGLPVPEPLAAMAEFRLGVLYRGWLVMAEMPETISAWEFLRSGGSELVAPLAGALRRAHDCGLAHPDLHWTNILVARSGGELVLAFVDLDRARLRGLSLGERQRRRALRRLRRSARRLDPEGRVLDEGFLRRLEGAYWTNA